ncbi:hypothetical protein [Sphingomonas sp.]|uniref:hypothetical protein n=1 Tax=Sphingomonas sp. TaxID=28214 RepID=UPI003CC53557
MFGATADRELLAIGAKAQHPDPAHRYDSAAAIIADFDRWRAMLPVRAMPDRRRYRIAKFVERHRRGVMATGAALVLLSAASLIATSSYVRAEQSRRSAAARFGEVRTLSGFMLFDLYDQLAAKPGTVAARAQLAATSAQYLDRLHVAADAPADLQLQTAISFRRLAAIQGLPGTSNLGHPDLALVSLARAEALLRGLIAAGPRDEAVWAQLGWVLSDRWSLHRDGAQSQALNAAARAAFARALALASADPVARAGAIQSEENAAYDLIWTADAPAVALVRARRALASLRAQRWPVAFTDQVATLQIQLLDRIGDALYYGGDIPGSLAPYREADALIDRMIATRGAIPTWLIRKGESAFNISGSLGDMPGREADALAVAQDGIASLTQLLGFGPDAAAEKKLLVLLGQKAALLDQLGRTHDALTPSLASVSLRERRLAGSPGDAQRRRDLAIGIAPYAELLAKDGQPRPACAAAGRAVAIWAGLQREGTLGVLDARKNAPHAQTLQRNFCTP